MKIINENYFYFDLRFRCIYNEQQKQRKNKIEPTNQRLNQIVYVYSVIKNQCEMKKKL